MTAIRYEIDLQARLMDRVQLVCQAEGVNVDSFLESAIRDAVLDAERRSPFVRDAFRDADRYPHVCREPGCGRRFKLKAHLGNHKRSHEEETYGGPGNPRKKAQEVVEPEPVSNPQPEWPDTDVPDDDGPYGDPLAADVGPQGELLEPEFKLAPGIDPSLIELDDEPDPFKADHDFSGDVPEI